MDATTEAVNSWPPRPVDEVFPEVLDSLGVAQLLGFDRRRKTPDQGRRSVLGLVAKGMPTMGRVGSAHLFDKSAVLGWLATRGQNEV